MSMRHLSAYRYLGREIMPGTDNDSHEFIQSLLTRIMTATGVVPDFHHYLTQFRGYLNHHGQGDHEEIVFPSEKGRKYRVRKVRGRLNGDEEALKDQFIKGHGLLFHLYHPNVVSIYGTFRDGTDMCFVSPSIPGCSLHEYLKSASPGFVERKLLISDVVNGLEYLQRHDIVHGDLRLDTILISDDGRALLGDFVVARIENGKGAVATEPNTRPMRWRPPESFDTYKSRYGWKPSPMVGDVWQFGCVCYTIITNEQPFERYWTDKRVKQALQARELPGRRLQTGESSRFWGMIEKCWRSFEREGSLSPRPSSAEQLKKLLPAKLNDGRHNSIR
ncbi:hypothetical protein AGABI1DRAFT_128623 [Agaricus bisporus var. burnettii JB137-S8]|uniref:Protein kinase domain-containing protein n=1 Tax=Agaricus bisporus var. burnettii (strain JB137-S8 / ATCC MYA-4627 / FGSC 10392) TaxID=597362 RepID=K5WVG5_AGABU|nr:uncharacterized protein AGABI1DRAFT_128623 [Agaricus bisporus var. burnettii JB137-S8]EKM79471.1 hypothetical protein AGABI1DRAFT_128623 [Agaricus bisporus var. burnettii JB137-S8]